MLLLAKGGRLPTGARVWGHLFVCGLFLGALPFTLFALSETRISSALAGIGNATTPIVAVLATIAILPGERVTGSRLVAVLVGFLGVVTIMQPWTSVDRPDLVGFSMALVGGASYGIGWTYNRRFLSGVDLGGLSQPAATLLTALVLMVPVMLGWAAFQPEGLAAIWSYDAPDSGTWFWLPLACVLVLGLVGTGFAYMLQFDVVRGAGPVIGSTITYLIPVVSVLLGVFVLGESLGPLAARRVRHRAERGVRRQPQAARTRGRLGARARADRQPGSLTPSAGVESSASPAASGPAAASAAAQLRRASTATTTETSPSAMTARRPPTTSRGGPVPAAVPPVPVGRRAPPGPSAPPGPRRRRRARAAGSIPRAGRGAGRAPTTRPTRAGRAPRARRRSGQPHQTAVGGVRPGEERDAHPEHDGDDEQRRPHPEQREPRGAANGRRGARGSASDATEADGIREPGEPLTPRPGRAPRGAGSCRSGPWAARGRPTPCAGTCRRRSAPW